MSRRSLSAKALPVWILTLILAAAVGFSLASCGSKATDSQESIANSSADGSGNTDDSSASSSEASLGSPDASVSNTDTDSSNLSVTPNDQSNASSDSSTDGSADGALTSAENTISFIEEVKAQSYTVTSEGVVPSTSGKSFGVVVDSYCPGGTWVEGTSPITGVMLVQYSGGTSSAGVVGIQWIKGEEGWSVYAMQIAGQSASIPQICKFFSEALN
ncbi:MAG: hypothetical protein LBH87_04185 [Coriobacteriales bacterium]|jgi:hypothetical protein|nr:hypothetical protein [Coriobacteriales bacterium]